MQGAGLLCTRHLSMRCGILPRVMACATQGRRLRRHFSPQCTTTKADANSLGQESKVIEDSFVYRGPLSKPFRRLKIFSLSSIGLTVTLSPVLFIVDSGLPTGARISLAAIALGTSSLSTALIAFCAKPYVTTLRRFRPDRTGSAEVIEMTTQSLLLKPLVTTVYDPSFLHETTRPFAQWELANKIHLTSARTEAVGANVHPEEGAEETVAETKDANGTIIGRWVVKWGADGEGTCHQMGYVVRYFNVHEELLQ